MENSFISIKNWAAEDRPREKMIKYGATVLSNAELLAILIGTGTKKESAVDLSKRILNTVENNLDELGKLSVSEFTGKFKGIGDAKAVTIMASLELGKRRKISEILEKKAIKNSNDVAEFFMPIVSDIPHEEFWILLVNRAHKIIDKFKISQGGISGTVTDIRLIYKIALEKLASGLFICHNHPSGNLKPSNSDIEITKKIKDAGLLFEINLLDHIIISGPKYLSFADEGML